MNMRTFSILIALLLYALNPYAILAALLSYRLKGSVSHLV